MMQCEMTWHMAGRCQVAIFDIPPPAQGKAGNLP